MVCYRLYTVVPSLLGLIDNTTNLYIRFNWKRLKGEYGLDDTIHALNTLFEILFTLCKGLAPFTPFITETIYSKLLPHIPKNLQGEDPRSVHFLPYPNLARVSRERRTIGLETPLKTLVVIHSDSKYLVEVKSLETYITEELNIGDLVLTSDEAKYNVQYSVAADWPVLGKKFGKDLARVKKALPNVAGDEGDLRAKRELKQDESQTLEPNTDDDVPAILDAAIYPELAEEGVAREIINRMEYKVLSDPEDIGLSKVFDSQAQAFVKAPRRPIDKHEVTQVNSEIPNEKEEGIITEEEQEVQKATFLFRLLKL
ncbi:hypothetical protein F4823DRAFT_557890 [Ustulina deusta]|nr:hypothetical protein F4823DRAFT_557890 [Ustulina deusta]